MAQEILVPAKLDPSSKQIIVNDIAQIKPPPVIVKVNMDSTSLNNLKSATQNVKIELDKVSISAKSMSSQLQSSFSTINTSYSSQIQSIDTLRLKLQNLQGTIKSLNQNTAKAATSSSSIFDFGKTAFSSLVSGIGKMKSYVAMTQFLKESMGKISLLSGKCAHVA